MLSAPEKVAFLLLTFLSVALAVRAGRRIIRTIARGSGRPDWSLIPRRLVSVLANTISFAPVFRSRLLASALHGLVGWGFIYYLVVNLGDVLQGYLAGYAFLGRGWVGDLYRLGADMLSVGVLAGMLGLLVRRYLLRPEALSARDSILLHPKARAGIRRDSAIVGLFILLHVGARLTGESFHLAASEPDAWQPFASAVAVLWARWPAPALVLARHVSWWLALGLILAFVPYFLYSKHLHLIMAPINFLLRPQRRSLAELDPLDFDDQQIEHYGAERLEDLSWSAIMDAYACIMCNRCQDACPAYTTGKVLSPAALEINKRYFLNDEGVRLAAGQSSSLPLLDFAITSEAVWACTACGACIDVCPVGNEPMHDILEIRRHLVLMANEFPEPLQAAYRGMERAANPWNIAADTRLEWAQGLDVPTIDQVEDYELLWWVGCAPATDPRAQKTAQALARVLHAAGVRFAVLGKAERCTGDPARRSGNEYLFFELASANVETLNQAAPPRIVTTCPHCLHTLKNEYPAFGGHYQVVHHTELIDELVAAGRLRLKEGVAAVTTFHDPCYLGRNNGIHLPPRRVLQASGTNMQEMPRNQANSFCCGAGGAQMWKEEEAGQKRVSVERIQEAQGTGAEVLAVGCPFCMIMLSDAAGAEGGRMAVRDVVEIIADQVDEGDSNTSQPPPG
jgi:Fe-S oxidoreductase